MQCNCPNADAIRLHHPNDDAIIITLTIADFITKKMLVYNGSLVNILYYPNFKQWGLTNFSSKCSLIGFEGTKFYPVGTISMPDVVGSYPRQITKEVNFLVMDCLSFYNTIIGQPILNT